MTGHVKLLFEFCCSVVYYYKIKQFAFFFTFSVHHAQFPVAVLLLDYFAHYDGAGEWNYE